MYIPKHNEETDLRVLHGLIRACPLGAWVTLGAGVTPGDGELLANHIPFLLDAARGEFGTLVAHVARANPVWRSFSGSIPSVVIFQGPQTYITPSWYAGKATHGREVPTWNYAVVHAHGIPRVIEDVDWLLAHVTQLVDTHEAGEAVPWKVSDAPAEFIDKMLGGIVGVEIPIARITGKWKVSQNRSDLDKLGVVEGLTKRGNAESVQMSALVEEYRLKG